MVPGLALAKATSSRVVFAGSEGCATSSNGKLTMLLMAVKSFTGS